ncbi:MAG TPA: hypothetical protein PKK03_11325 [Bacteroidales bacterium]|nr:hypothetical protein [Bacteroidales bacterium]HPS98511.1 hypothetical protein [Bacteroidales bacterium]
MKKILLTGLILLGYSAVSGQTVADTLRKDALNVFMEASDYVRKEIPYVNYVRDIKDAGLYIISTTQMTGSGGREFTYFFIGQNENQGMRDTLKFTSSPDETSELIRENEVRTLKLGLIRYVARTPLARFLKISFSEPLAQTVTTDKWNSWVFKTSVSGYASGEKSYRSSYLNGSFSANRVTEKLKSSVSLRYSYSSDKYEVDDELITSEYNSKSLSGLLVGSLTDHWSVGGSMYAGASRYNNSDLSFNIQPGIEYNVFPYSESTRRQLRITYKLGLGYENYIDTTIYNKVKENLFSQYLTVNYEVIQKWGSANLSLGYSNYLHDWSKNNISLNAFLDLRIAKGLSLNFGGGGAIVHDQLGLVKGGATQQEVLLRLRELETQFEYFTSFGLTYTFGSIYNNVVNPRFGNSGGGGMTIIMN